MASGDLELATRGWLQFAGDVNDASAPLGKAENAVIVQSTLEFDPLGQFVCHFNRKPARIATDRRLCDSDSEFVEGRQQLCGILPSSLQAQYPEAARTSVPDWGVGRGQHQLGIKETRSGRAPCASLIE